MASTFLLVFLSCETWGKNSGVIFFFPVWKIILFLYVWIQQRVQHSWTLTGTLARRQTASLSWPFTPTQTAVAGEVEVWEMVMPTARGAQGVSRIRTPTDRQPAVLWYYRSHDAWKVTFAADGWLQWSVCSWWQKGSCIQVRVHMDSLANACEHARLICTSAHNLVDCNPTRLWDIYRFQPHYPECDLTSGSVLPFWWYSMLSLCLHAVSVQLWCSLM